MPKLDTSSAAANRISGYFPPTPDEMRAAVCVSAWEPDDVTATPQSCAAKRALLWPTAILCQLMSYVKYSVEPQYADTTTITTGWTDLLRFSKELNNRLFWKHKHTYLDPSLASLIAQISELCEEPESDELGMLRPTEYSANTAKLRLLEAQNTASPTFAFPKGSVASDYAGGLRFEWVCGANAVHLSVASDEKGDNYIYHESSQGCAIDKDASGSNLYRRLKQLQ